MLQHTSSEVMVTMWKRILKTKNLQSDLQCKIKETLLIRDLKPALNENVGSEKLCLFLF